MTSDAVPKPAVNLARDFLNSLGISNQALKDVIVDKLTSAGGHATVHSLLVNLPTGFSYSDGWTAIYQMVASGLINHDHPKAGTAPLAARSWVRFVKEQQDDNSRAA